MIRLAIAALLLSAAPAYAETISCPDLAVAEQVGSCPSAQELKWGFNGYCSDNARMYDKDDTCASIENYKKMKDVALWEAGEFQGYLSCGHTPDRVKAAPVIAVTVSKVGTMTRVACAYEGNLVMSYRTKRPCRVEGTQAVCH